MSVLTPLYNWKTVLWKILGVSGGKSFGALNGLRARSNLSRIPETRRGRGWGGLGTIVTMSRILHKKNGRQAIVKDNFVCGKPRAKKRFVLRSPPRVEQRCRRVRMRTTPNNALSRENKVGSTNTVSNFPKHQKTLARHLLRQM